MLQARGLAIENTVHKGLNLKAFNGKALKPIAVRVNNQESTQYSMLWGGGYWYGGPLAGCTGGGGNSARWLAQSRSQRE